MEGGGLFPSPYALKVSPAKISLRQSFEGRVVFKKLFKMIFSDDTILNHFKCSFLFMICLLEFIIYNMCRPRSLSQVDSGSSGGSWAVLLDVKPPHITVWHNYPPAISTLLPMAYTLSWTAGGHRNWDGDGTVSWLMTVKVRALGCLVVKQEEDSDMVCRLQCEKTKFVSQWRQGLKKKKRWREEGVEVQQCVRLNLTVMLSSTLMYPS